jgi:hypothetical protein
MPKFLPIISVSFLAFAVFAGASTGNFGNSKPTISWSPEQVVQDQFPGTAKVITAKFTSQKDLNNVEFWIIPRLNKYAAVEPISIDKVEKNKEYAINIIISLPSDVKTKQFLDKDIEALLGNQADKDDKDFLKHWDKNKINGLLFVKADKTIPWFQFWKDKTKTIKIIQPKPLKISVNVKQPSAEVIPAEISLPSSDRIVSDPESTLEYVGDEVVAVFKEGTTIETIRNIISTTGGVFVGSEQRINLYQIRFLGADLSQIDAKINLLELKEEVDSAFRHPLYLRDL